MIHHRPSDQEQILDCQTSSFYITETGPQLLTVGSPRQIGDHAAATNQRAPRLLRSVPTSVRLNMVMEIISRLLSDSIDQVRSWRRLTNYGSRLNMTGKLPRVGFHV